MSCGCAESVVTQTDPEEYPAACTDECVLLGVELRGQAASNREAAAVGQLRQELLKARAEEAEAVQDAKAPRRNECDIRHPKLKF